MILDHLDRELIIGLQKYGRESYINLARLLNVSEATVRNRVKRLLNKGIIEVKAIPNLDILEYQFIGIVGVQIQLEDLHKVADQLTHHPNVCYLANVTGRYDFIAIVVTRTSKEFADFVENVMSRMSGIVRTETCISLNVYKGMGVNLDTAHLLINSNLSSKLE